MSYFRVRERIMFDSRYRPPIAVLTSNEYCFTQMVNVRRHGMFYQNRNNIEQHNNRINALPTVAGTTLSAAFASLKAAELKLARYAGCYTQGSLSDS